MKKAIVWCLLACLMMGLASCKESGPEEVMGEVIIDSLDIYILHDLCLCVKDSEGKDLVKSLPLKEWSPMDSPEDQADRGIFAPDSYFCSLTDNRGYTFNMLKSLTGDRMVEHRFVSYIPFNNPETTSMITSPLLFGDGKQHTLKAYWDVHYDNTMYVQYAECKRVEFDGKEITDIVYTDHPYYFHEKSNIVTIILP